MKKQITDTFVSIPPYLSVRWSDVRSLAFEDEELIVSLKDGNQIYVPHLSKEDLEEIFEAHLVVMNRSEELTSFDEDEMEESLTLRMDRHREPPVSEVSSSGGEVPFLRMDLSQMGQVGTMMQHNPDQSDMPPIPPEVLAKIAKVAQALGPVDTATIPQPEPHCNCVHCQITRAIHQVNLGEEVTGREEEGEMEEEVSDEDLSFLDWIVIQDTDNEKMFTVTNPLNREEKYRVFLGEPVGCTCGEAHCEHIVAALQS